MKYCCKEGVRVVACATVNFANKQMFHKLFNDLFGFFFVPHHALYCMIHVKFRLSVLKIVFESKHAPSLLIYFSYLQIILIAGMRRSDLDISRSFFFLLIVFNYSFSFIAVRTTKMDSALQILYCQYLCFRFILITIFTPDILLFDSVIFFVFILDEY